MKSQRKILQNFHRLELKILDTKYYSWKVFTLNIHKMYIVMCKEVTEMDKKNHEYLSIHLSKAIADLFLKRNKKRIEKSHSNL